MLIACKLIKCKLKFLNWIKWYIFHWCNTPKNSNKCEIVCLYFIMILLHTFDYLFLKIYNDLFVKFVKLGRWIGLILDWPRWVDHILGQPTTSTRINHSLSTLGSNKNPIEWKTSDSGGTLKVPQSSIFTYLIWLGNDQDIIKRNSKKNYY